MTEKQLERKARFRIIVKSLNIDRQELADTLGYKKKYLDQVLSADKNLSDALLLKFTKRYKSVNEDWLIDGIGEMFLSSSAAIGDKVNEPAVKYGNDSEPFEMLRIWKESFEDRMKKLEAEVERMSELLGDEGKGGG